MTLEPGRIEEAGAALALILEVAKWLDAQDLDAPVGAVILPVAPGELEAIGRTAGGLSLMFALALAGLGTIAESETGGDLNLAAAVVADQVFPLMRVILGQAQ